MNQLELLNLIGRETERLAKPILEKEFDKVEWVSVINPASPFDFACYDDKKKYYIDVKSCMSGLVYISKNKYNKLLKKKITNFYFMLLIKEGFRLISFENLIKSNKYKIHNIKYKYRSSSTVRIPRGECPTKNISLLGIVRKSGNRRQIEIPRYFHNIFYPGAKVTISTLNNVDF